MYNENQFCQCHSYKEQAVVARTDNTSRNRSYKIWDLAVYDLEIRNGTARLYIISSRENGTYSVQPLYIPETFV